MRFEVKDKLTEEEIENGLKGVIKDGLASQALTTLTGGIFLVAFALELGASNVIIGLLAAIPPLAQLIQIPSIYLVEKYRNRCKISVLASALSRTFWLPIALIPFIFSPQEGLIFLVIAVLLYLILGSVGGCSWNSWMCDLVPMDKLGLFFSKRMFYATVVGIVLSIAAGIYIDYWKKLFPGYALQGYSVLFFLGFLAGMIGVYYLSTIPEPRMMPVNGKIDFLKLILQPLRDANYKQLIIFLGSWNFAVNLAAPFFTVYMLMVLKMDISSIVALAILSQVMNLSFLRIWGRFSDKFSNKSVLAVSGPLFLISIFAWAFMTTASKYQLTIPLLIVIHIFTGISTAGVSLASGNIGLKLAPKGQATAYLASNSLVNSFAAGSAPILGGRFADYLAGQKLFFTLTWASPTKELNLQTLYFEHWDFLFLFAFFIGLYSLHRLAMVKEKGEVEEKVLVHEFIVELRNGMRNFSTAGGLRQLTKFPYSIVRSNLEKRIHKKNKTLPD
ncbi:MAG: MFS transporter [Candidatus Methanoperedens sp.]|nr:MFS transporter [Candidatus Methanoperedens sp.]